MNKYIATTLMFGILALTACKTTMPPPEVGLISFAQYPPYYLNVAKVETVDEYKSPMRTPNVEHLMPYSPSEAMHIWINDRLRARGGDKTLQVIIKDASVVAKDLPKTPGITGFFTDDQDKLYDGKMEVEMRIYGDDPLSEANVDVNAHRSVTIDEKASAAKRQAIMRKLVDDMMSDINSELEKNIPIYFANYLNSPLRR